MVVDATTEEMLLLKELGALQPRSARAALVEVAFACSVGARAQPASNGADFHAVCTSLWFNGISPIPASLQQEASNDEEDRDNEDENVAGACAHHSGPRVRALSQRLCLFFVPTSGARWKGPCMQRSAFERLFIP